MSQPATRIISLSPHITELLFEAGAGEKIIATVKHSDYPNKAKDILRIGDSHSFDLETLLGLKPDLIILWKSGTRESLIQAIQRLHIPVYFSEPNSLNQIAATINNFGKLAGTEQTAARQSDQFLKKLDSLTVRYQNVKPVTVFYQFWSQPVFTVGKTHLINQVIELCGGKNIFSDLSTLTPQVDKEAILLRNPQVIITSGNEDISHTWLNEWQQWPELNAVKNKQLYFIHPDLLLRHTSRILQGAELMCQQLDSARKIL